MFRELRKKKKAIGPEAVNRLLETERRGVLAVNGDDGYPYAVPVNFLYCEAESRIYFHGSRVGHKADSIKRDARVCFTVFGNESVKDEAWAPYVQSAVIFGKCRMIEDRDRVIALVKRLARKYYPDETLIDREVAADGAAVQLFEIEIEQLTGKEIQER